MVAVGGREHYGIQGGSAVAPDYVAGISRRYAVRIRTGLCNGTAADQKSLNGSGSIQRSRPSRLTNFYEPDPTASSGAVGMCARPGGWAVVQRFVHDIASLQYHWMSAHAWLPSGTRRPSGSAMPHKEHWAASNGRGRLGCVAAGGFAGAGSVIEG